MMSSPAIVSMVMLAAMLTSTVMPVLVAAVAEAVPAALVVVTLASMVLSAIRSVVTTGMLYTSTPLSPALTTPV